MATPTPAPGSAPTLASDGLIGTARRISLNQRIVLAALLVIVGVAVAHNGWLWRADNLIYDLNLRLWRSAPPQEIVIVGIDEASLNAIGRWPWRRSVHASLVDELAVQGARVIAIDVLFLEADSDHPGDDAQFAAAIRNAGNVVLPVIVEEVRLGGQIFEHLPLPLLTEAAHGIGHVHVELDDDGMARAVYLRAGLGYPRWHSFAMMADEIANGRTRENLPGLRNENPVTSAHVWSRDFRVMVPFAGPPGHFQQISYINVLSGDYPAGVFKDKLVLIGTTAVGVGDTLPTPVSGKNRRMAGVEFHANALHALRGGELIEPLPGWLVTLVTALFAVVPMFVYPRAGPRGGLLAAAVLLLLPAALSFGLLVTFGKWLAPAAAIAVLALSYPLWSWTRLNSAVRFLADELERLGAEQDRLPVVRRPPFAEATRFIRWLLPVDGAALVDGRGRVHKSFGQAPQWRRQSLEPGKVMQQGAEVWGAVTSRGRVWRLGNHWSDGEPEPRHLELLESILRLQSDDAAPLRALGAVEVLEGQIMSVRQANERVRTVRRILDASLDQMADGLLVVTSLGTVMLANEQAGRLLCNSPSEELAERPIADLLDGVTIEAGREWPAVLAEVLVDRRAVQMSVVGPGERPLLLHLAPLSDQATGLLGFTVTVADLTSLNESERRRHEMVEFLSHDLRSPITSLLAVVELNRETADPHDLRAALLRCERHARTALRLADGFSAMSRAESTEVASGAVADVVQLAHSAADAVRPQCEKRGMILRVDAVDEAAWAHADAPMLERVLQNLLVNAAKYAGESSLVSLTVRVERDHVVSAVTDQGPGIAKQDLDRIWERFERLEDHGRGTGVGLGLAFVKAAVMRMGGDIGVESTLGGGSTFSVRLQRALPPAANEAAAE